MKTTNFSNFKCCFKKDKAKILTITSIVTALVVISTLSLSNHSKIKPTLDIPDDTTPFSSLPALNEQSEDINVIPDKYNTGVDTSVEFTTISAGTTYNGIYFKITMGLMKKSQRKFI